MHDKHKEKFKRLNRISFEFWLKKKLFFFQSQETNWYFLLKHHFFTISLFVNCVNENAIVNNTKKSIDIEFESRIMLGSY